MSNSTDTLSFFFNGETVTLKLGVDVGNCEYIRQIEQITDKMLAHLLSGVKVNFNVQTDLFLVKFANQHLFLRLDENDRLHPVTMLDIILNVGVLTPKTV